MSKKLLHIDPDKTAQEIVAATLPASRYDISQASTAKDALKSIQYTKPDLIIMETNLPDQNGIDFIAHIRKDEAIKDTPIIILSAEEKLKIETKYKDTKIIGIIPKPIKVNELANTLTYMLA